MQVCEFFFSFQLQCSRSKAFFIFVKIQQENDSRAHYLSYSSTWFTAWYERHFYSLWNQICALLVYWYLIVQAVYWLLYVWIILKQYMKYPWHFKMWRVSLKWEQLVPVVKNPHLTHAPLIYNTRADSRFAHSQWGMVLLCNDITHWLGTNLGSALQHGVSDLTFLSHRMLIYFSLQDLHA